MSGPGRELPLVSVVVPSYNRARFLRETIDSVLAQDYPHIECIVADGGSTDGTLAILESYGGLVRWWSEADGGPFNGVNRGWQESRGEILAWLNADDRWAPGAVTAAVRLLLEHPEVGVVYGHCGVIDVDGRFQWLIRAKPWSLERAVMHCDHIIDQPAAFVRRDAVERVGGMRRGWLHDQDLWIRLALSGAVFAAIDRRLADGRVHRGNMGSDARRVIPWKREIIAAAFDSPLLPAKYRARRRRAISNAYVRGFDSLQPGRPAHWLLGLQTLGRAVATDPGNSPRIAFRLAQLFLTFARRGLRDPRLR